MTDDNKKQIILRDEAKKTVSIIKPKYNLLKNKAGARTNMKASGFIDENKINAADELITKVCINSEQELKKQIKLLADIWKCIQEMPDGYERKEKTEEILTIAHEIKDIGALCGYDLIAHFAESLRDYIGEITMNIKNQRIIIQAHVDALSTVLKTRVSDDTDPIAKELKEKVKIAIEQYS
jgi:chemotaxis protein histidine kinase CheA